MSSACYNVTFRTKLLHKFKKSLLKMSHEQKLMSLNPNFEQMFVTDGGIPTGNLFNFADEPIFCL